MTQTFLKRGFKLLAAHVLRLTLLFLLSSPSLSHSGDIIFAVKSRDISPYNLALKGIQDLFKERGDEPVFRVHDLGGKEEAWKDVLKKIREERPRIVFTLGTLATEQAKRDIKEIPIIFSSVLNPGESKFVSSLSYPGGNITGASLDIPAETQFSLLLELLPSAKRVGVIYNPRETGSTVEEAKRAAAGMGLALETEAVRDETDLPAAMERLFRRIDVLWAVADSTVFSPPAIQEIIIETIRRKVPFMGLSPSFVKGGALFSVRWDDADIGRQAGETALKVINGTARPSFIPVTTPRDVSLSVNLQTAGKVGVAIPDKVLKRAEVFR